MTYLIEIYHRKTLSVLVMLVRRSISTRVGLMMLNLSLTLYAFLWDLDIYMFLMCMFLDGSESIRCLILRLENIAHELNLKERSVV